jgi:hypothetical protein
VKKIPSIPDIIWTFRLSRYTDPVKRVAASKYAKKTARLIKKGMSGFGEEASETRIMADSFFRMLAHKLRLNERTTPPTEEEVKAAIEQLKDVGRFSIFATVSLLPGGGFSLIGLELLARRLGVKKFTLIPSAFRKKGKASSEKNQDRDSR